MSPGCVLGDLNAALHSVLGGAPLHSVDVGVAIGGAAAALAFPNHLAQGLHGFVMRAVQGVAFGAEQLYRLTDASRLVNRALLAHRQVHGQMQKGVGLAVFHVIHACERCIDIGKVSVVFRVLGHPLAGQSFQRVHGLGLAPLGIDRTKETPNIGLAGFKHRVIVAQLSQPIRYSPIFTAKTSRDAMINKVTDSIAQALQGLTDDMTIMVGGFGTAGIPSELLDGLVQMMRDSPIAGLTIVNNNAGNGDTGLAGLLKTGRVRKVICSFPRQADSHVFDALYRAGKVELELVPQGNLSERIRAAGAGIGGFFTPTGYGTELAKHADGSAKETREINGRMYVLELPIHADLALIKAEKGDRWGNLTYRKSARNFGPVMAAAAKRTVASVHEVVALGALDPESVVTPGIYVSHVVPVPRQATQGAGFKKAA